MKHKLNVLILFLGIVFITSSCQNTTSIEHLVSNNYELVTAIKNANPGEKITMKNGVWKDVQIKFIGNGEKGNPITLGILYISLAQELGIPIYGVSIPRNFILAYVDEYNLNDPYEEDILFYINPYNNGKVLGEREIDYFLIRNTLVQSFDMTALAFSPFLRFAMMIPL